MRWSCGPCHLATTFALARSPCFTELRQAAFSCDGRYLALSCHGFKRKTQGGSGGSVSWVTVLFVSEGFQECACICAAWPPAMRWAPDAPHLSVAWVSEPDSGAGAGAVRQLAVRVLDAADGTILHAMDNSADVSHAGMQCMFQDLDWSPGGDMLLVTSHGRSAQGALTVVHAQRQAVAAESRFFCNEREVFGNKAVWHPTSPGLILSTGISLQTAEVFASAGLAVGRLPEPYRLDRQSKIFSPDGQRLVVEEPEAASSCSVNTKQSSDEQELPQPGTYSVLRCKAVGQCISFQLDQKQRAHDYTWMPCSSKLLMDLGKRASHLGLCSRIVDLTGQQPDLVVGLPMRAPICISPSGDLIGHSSGGIRIWSLSAGKDVLTARNERHPVQDHFSYHLSFQAFLPSGCCLLCSSVIAMIGLATTLYVFSFA